MHPRTIADLLTTLLTREEATALIQTLHKSADGAELLRLIVRDDIGGAGDLIANSLWVA